MKVLTAQALGTCIFAFGIGVGAFAAPHSRPKAAANGQCRVLTAAIDETVMDMSAIEADGVGDDSAPRATMRETQIGAKQTEIQNDIALMRANGCAPYSHSLSPNRYLISAIQCDTARMKEQTAKEEANLGITPTPPKPDEQPSSVACDRTKWKPTIPGG